MLAASGEASNGLRGLRQLLFAWHLSFAEWYDETAKSVYLPEVYMAAAKHLIAEGKITADEIPAADFDGYKPPTSDFIDGIEYDGKKPIKNLNSHKIGNKDPA